MVFSLPRNLSEEQVVYNNLDINIVIPAKAGIQERHLENHPLWIPAFAGMTKEKLCRMHRPVPGRKPVARRYISLSHKWEREKNHPSSNTVQLSAQTYDFVIPAKAGIQERHLDTTLSGFPLSRE